MNYAKLPAPVLAKLLTLEQGVEDLSQRLTRTKDAIASTRARLTGGFSKQSEYDDLRATLDQLVADKAVLETKLQAAQSLQSACKIRSGSTGCPKAHRWSRFR